jgi:hypothetical protein
MALLTKGLRTALLFLLAGILMLFYFYWRWDVFVGYGSVDIHVYDTYLVMTYFHVAIVILLVLTLFFSLGGMIGSRFRNWFYIILFFCCCLVVGFIIWEINNSS